MKTEIVFLIAFWVVIEDLCAQSVPPGVNNEADLLTQTADDNLSFSMDWTSKYIWRDFVFGYNAVQPSLDIGFGDAPLAVNLWQSIGKDTSKLDLQHALTLVSEAQFSSALSGSFGLVYYVTVENSSEVPDGHSSELLVSLNAATFLEPSVSFYLSNTREVYGVTALSRCLASSDHLVITLYGSLGYRLNAEDKSKNGIRNVDLELETIYSFEKIHLGVFVRGTFISSGAGKWGQVGIRLQID